MNVATVNSASCLHATVRKMVNRSTLKPQKSCITNLCGPEEVKQAKKWVAAYTATNAGIAALMAQAPGADEVMLAGVEVAMATHILNGIYNFDFSKTLLKTLGTAASGNIVGKSTFKLASKAFTWIPGVGNSLNAIVSGTTTAAIGAALIDKAEEMDRARRNGKKLDDFFKKMEG